MMEQKLNVSDVGNDMLIKFNIKKMFSIYRGVIETDQLQTAWLMAQMVQKMQICNADKASKICKVCVMCCVWMHRKMDELSILFGSEVLDVHITHIMHLNVMHIYCAEAKPIVQSCTFVTLHCIGRGCWSMPMSGALWTWPLVSSTIMCIAHCVHIMHKWAQS